MAGKGLQAGVPDPQMFYASVKASTRIYFSEIQDPESWDVARPTAKPCDHFWVWNWKMGQQVCMFCHAVKTAPTS